MTIKAEYSLEDLAKLLQVDTSGDPQTLVTGLATLSEAGSSDLSFYHNPQFSEALNNTRAAVVILHPKEVSRRSGAALLSENPYATYAKASQLFCEKQVKEEGIHKSACIHNDAILGKNIFIGANVIIEAGCEVGDSVIINANCVIGSNCHIGSNSVLQANVSLYHDTTLGEQVIIHSGTVVGSDGFGYAHDGERYIKIAQLGGVKIGNDVEIGACCSIDRGALDDTIIEDGVKIDNQVQIAHNVKIGAHSIICGCSAIAGSSTLGKNCIIAGGVGIINHITIADGVTVTAMSLVNQDIKEAGVYSSGTGLSETKEWKKNIVRFRDLDQMSKRINELEKNQDTKA